MTADFCNKICTFETSTGVRYTAASLIGRSGSSTLRPSTTPMSLSLAGSRFSSDTTPGALPSWDSRTRHNNLSGGLAVRRTRGHNPTVTREGTWEELAQILAGDRTVGLFEHLRKFKQNPGTIVEKVRVDSEGIHYRSARPQPDIKSSRQKSDK